MYVPTMWHDKQTQFVLLKLSLHPRTVEKDKQCIDTTFNVRKSNIVRDSRRRRIFFFYKNLVCIYNIDSMVFEETLRSLNAPIGIEASYAAFDGQIFALGHHASNLKIFTLNEITFCWELCLQKVLPIEIHCLASCSSNTEMAIILESVDDCMDHIYKLNHQLKTLTFFKTTHAMSTYLYIPKHIYC